MLNKTQFVIYKMQIIKSVRKFKNSYIFMCDVFLMILNFVTYLL